MTFQKTCWRARNDRAIDLAGGKELDEPPMLMAGSPLTHAAGCRVDTVRAYARRMRSSKASTAFSGRNITVS